MQQKKLQTESLWKKKLQKYLRTTTEFYEGSEVWGFFLLLI